MNSRSQFIFYTEFFAFYTIFERLTMNVKSLVIGDMMVFELVNYEIFTHHSLVVC
jgi:hypothetical protein